MIRAPTVADAIIILSGTAFIAAVIAVACVAKQILSYPGV